jgi:hypothetical protein
MTESQIQVQSAAQVLDALSGVYNFNLSASGQLQLTGQENDTVTETENETILTADGGESQSDVQSAGQAVAALSGVYNFNLSASGQLQLTGQENDTITETENETIVTS